MSLANRRSFLCASTVLLAPWLAKAQPARSQPVRIGILVGGSVGQRGHLEQALLDGMRERGYVEGKNLVVERRYADGRYERVPGYARDLAQMNLDAVVTTCTGTTSAAKQATASTPIVMAAVADPVGQGLVASLARPGGNLTGLSSQSVEILPKMLGLFSAVLPKSPKVAVFLQGNSAIHPRMWSELAPIARPLKVSLVKVVVANGPDLPAAFGRALGEGANALLVLPDEPLFLVQRATIVSQASARHWPAIYGAREFVDDGGLMSYGERLSLAYRRAASYVTNLVRGAAAGELPVEQPKEFELAINLKSAAALGIRIPDSMLATADHVVR